MTEPNVTDLDHADAEATSDFDTDTEAGPRFEPAYVIAGYLAVFGAMVLVAIAFTDEARGRAINAACGSLLLLVAAGFATLGRHTQAKLKAEAEAAGR